MPALAIAPAPEIEYEDDWLPADFQPLSFRQLCWKKIKGAPLVGVGTFESIWRRSTLISIRGRCDDRSTRYGFLSDEIGQFEEIQLLVKMACRVRFLLLQLPPTIADDHD
jgi:hypothetical protein